MDKSQNSPDAQSASDNNGASKKKSKLGLILGLSIGGGVLLIGVLVTVLILVLGGGVSKQDYVEAQEAASDLRTSYSSVSSMYVSMYKTETEIKNDLDDLKKDRAEFDDQFEALGKMKAIKNDKEANELYKKAAEQVATLDTFLDTVVEVYEVIYPIIKEMEDLSLSDAEEAISVLKGYQTKIANLNVKQKVNKDYVDQLNKILPDYVKAIEAYANAETYSSSLYKDVSTQTTNLSNADSDWRSNLTKLGKDADFAKVLNELGKYLTDKVNE